MWKRLKFIILGAPPKPIASRLVSAPVNTGNWDESDRANLARFFKADCGVKLLARARSVEYLNALAASKDVMHTAHSAGRACGFTDCLNWMESLSRPAATQQETNTEVGEQNQTDISELMRF